MRCLISPCLMLLGACSTIPAEDQPLMGDESETIDVAVPERPPYVGPDYFPSILAETRVDCGRAGPPGGQQVVGEFEQRWFSRHLAAAQELPLYRPPDRPVASGQGSLRFTWLRTFHKPVVIRIERSADGAQILAKELTGAGGYDPGTVGKSMTRPLAPAELKRIEEMAGHLFAQPAAICDLGLDGGQWIFEAMDERGYRFSNRWTPEKGPARRLGQFLMGLTGWEFGAVY